MLKVDLITGFLGAGKTTFIKKYADYLISKGEKVHIIENDFGSISIDARALKEENLDVSEIAGGCMCCTGRVSFLNLLTEAANAGFDRVLVEPSGIYDVNSFFDMLQTPPVDETCTIGNVITIVDSVTEENLSVEAQCLLFSQLQFTGCVVVSKTQLREAAEVEDALQALQALLEANGSDRNLEAEHLCITKPWDQLDEADLERISCCGYRKGKYSSRVMDHMSIFKVAMMGGRFDTLEHLDAILHELLDTEKYGRIYRIKGYISDLEKNWYEISGSPSGCFVEKAKVKRGIFLVIGQGFDEAGVKSLFIPR